MTSPADWQLPPGVSRGLWDYLHDDEVAESYDTRLAGTPLFEIDQRFAAKHFDRPGRLIDLGCGTGRLAVAFAVRGYDVVGVDLSEAMLRATHAKAAATSVVVDLIRANLVELDALGDESFEYAACLFSTLGMITGEAERRRAIGHVYRLLRPGGRFVLHVHNYWFNLRDANGRRWLISDLARAFCGRPGGDRPMPRHHGLADLALHHFTRREAVRMLRAVGFRLLEVCPISLRHDGRLTWPWWFGSLRTYGYLIAARRPS